MSCPSLNNPNNGMTQGNEFIENMIIIVYWQMIIKFLPMKTFVVLYVLASYIQCLK